MKRILAPVLVGCAPRSRDRDVACLRWAAPAPRPRARRRCRAPRARQVVRHPPDVASTALSATQIYKQASTGVVAIKAVTAEGEDEGTGIVLNDKGLILTNDHVVAGATALSVAVHGSSSDTTSATLVGEEANEDLALIKVNPAGLGLNPLSLASAKGAAGRRLGLRDRQPLRPGRDADARNRLGAQPHDLGA